MIRKDYILNLVEQLALMLSKLMGLKQNGDYEAAINEIDQFLFKNTKTDLLTYNHLSLKQLVDQLNAKVRPADEWRFIADVLFEEAEIRLLMNDEQSCLNTRHKVFIILVHLQEHTPTTYSLQAEEKLNKLRRYIEEYEIPSDVGFYLFNYWLQNNKFAKAEDQLFNLLEMNQLSPQLLQEAMAKYKNLLFLEDAVLEKGDLPKNEIIEGITLLKSKQFGQV